VDSINSRNLQSKIILNLAKKVGGLLRWKSNTPDSLFGQHPIEPSAGFCANNKSTAVQIWGFVELD
jgi:hypothetical protein